MAKEVTITVNGGTVIPVENCTYDAATSTLSFINDDYNCVFTLEPMTVGTVPLVSMGDYSLPKDPGCVTLEAHSEYGDILVEFVPDDDDEFCERLLGV